MGYTTDFSGAFAFSRQLTLTEYNTLMDFAKKEHPKTAPSKFCLWIPTRDGVGLKWNGGEKFDAYQEWLSALLTTFFKPWGVVLNGEVMWQGEELSDRGVLVIKDNVLTSRASQVTGKVVRCPECDHEFELE